MTATADQIYQQLLVLRCQTGDELALAELIARLDRRLRYYLRQIVNDSIDDVLQETWIDAWHGIDRLSNTQAFASWIYTIARRHALVHSRRRQSQTIDTNHDAIPDPRGDDADDDCFTAEDAARIHAGLEQLSPEHREVLVLRFIEDMSYDEIA